MVYSSSRQFFARCLAAGELLTMLIDLTTKPLTADFTALLASTRNPCLRAERAWKIITSKRPEHTQKGSKSFVKLSRFAGESEATAEAGARRRNPEAKRGICFLKNRFTGVSVG